jgi:septal ring factor EnvC (AmiA/AmiB activator)
MAKSSLLLGCIAFGVSGLLTLVGSRDGSRAFWAGASAVPAALTAQALVRRPQEGSEQRAQELQGHIHALQQRRQEAYQEFVEIQAEKERIALSLTSMHGQLRQNQLSGSSGNRRKISWDLTEHPVTPPPQAAHTRPTKMLDLPQPGAHAPTMLNPPYGQQGQQGPQSPDPLALRSTTLNPIDPRAPRPAPQDTSGLAPLAANLQALQSQQQQLQAEIAEHTQQRDRLQGEIPPLQRRVAQIKSELAGLGAQHQQLTQQIAALQTQQAQASPINSSIQTLQAQLRSLQAERAMVETELGDRRTQKQHLEGELAQIQEEIQTAQAAAEAMRNQPDAWGLTPPWRELLENLAKHEVQALRILATEANPAPQLKRIAEAQVTMPELLLDSINERALDTVGDLVLEATGNGAQVAQEYQEMVLNLLRSWESKHGTASQEVLAESV